MESALAVRSAVEAMGMGLLPYAALVLPPLVRALASQAEEVRAEAAAAFAALMPLLPLEADTP